MPTSTFYRLPQEKRERLLKACWTELTRARFAEVSVNRVILQAGISRGSFYQYFTDKEDMIRYLMESMRGYFVSLLRTLLEEADGDLFALPLRAFDRFFPQGSADPMLGQFIRVMKLNLGMDAQSFMADCPGFLPDPLWEAADRSLLRREDREYVDHVFHLLCAVLAYAVAGTLQDGSRRERERENLKIRVELLKCGCAARAVHSNEEVTA